MKGEPSAKNILFVSSVAAFYGGERSLLEIVSMMSRHWKARFVVPARGSFSNALESAKYPFDVLDWKSLDSLGGLFSVLRLAWIIRTRRMHLVHANLQYAAPLVAISSCLSGVPFVVHLRNMVHHGAGKMRSAMLFRYASAIICISQAVRDSAFAAGLLSPEQENQTYVIPDARNLSNYRRGDRARIRADLGISDDIPLIGMVARIDPFKGQHRFLEIAALVAKHFPSARFLLVGDVWGGQSSYLRTLKRRCEDPQLRGRVIFLGYRTDVPDILTALDCFVHPSEGGAFVSVLIEAMAIGVPIVVPDVDGIPECVGRDGAAELIDSLQPEDFANAVVQILRGPAHRVRMSLAAQERAKRYDAFFLARETEQVFEHCLAGFQRR